MDVSSILKEMKDKFIEMGDLVEEDKKEVAIIFKQQYGVLIAELQSKIVLHLGARQPETGDARADDIGRLNNADIEVNADENDVLDGQSKDNLTDTRVSNGKIIFVYYH